MKYKTREEWLIAAVKLLDKKLFKLLGYNVPRKVRVSLGWPSGNKNKVLGQAWSPKCSADKYNEIFISPISDDVLGKYGILATLVHELIHVTIGVDKGHKSEFKKAMSNLGLEGNAKATYASDALLDIFKHISKELGIFPHKKIISNKYAAVKKQTTRLIKVQCPECEYIARVTRTWLDECGAPICPVHNEQFVEK